MKTIYLACLFIISLLWSCSNNNKNDQIAKELCSCLRPIVNVYQETKGLNENDSPEDIQTAMEKMERAAAESDACADRMNAQYGDLADQQEAIEAAMERNCPDIVSTMSEIESTE
ncbi:MAG: hypothetical protein ACK4TA_17340 [Saprospiraceae bacterium]